VNVKLAINSFGDSGVGVCDFDYLEARLGPISGPYPDGCEALDIIYDSLIDLHDLAAFQNAGLFVQTP